MKKGTNYSGKAYAYFNCNASKEQISDALPTIREFARTPAKLELSLLEINEDLTLPGKRDVALRSLTAEAAIAGRQYFIEAKCPGKNNQETANEVATILNQAYQSPLYQEGEAFFGDIVYRQRSKYVFRE